MVQNKGKPFFKTCLSIKFGIHKWVALIKLLKSLHSIVHLSICHLPYIQGGGAVGGNPNW